MSVMILDGGMGQELIARSGKATALWSVQALLDAPEIVRAVHDDYFAAGAMIATTNSYSILPDRLSPHGLDDQLDRLQKLACTLAIEARDAHGQGMVLGSHGPLGFSYQPDHCPPADQAAEVYAKICKIQEPFVDAFIFETMSSIDQARGGLMGASGVSNKPIWVAFSVDDHDGTKLRSGEPVADILPLVEQYNAASVLINCSTPEAVSIAIKELSNAKMPIGAYANGFTHIHEAFNKIGATVDLLERRQDLGPAAYLEFAKTWADDGAQIIGGCCEVGPEHIALLASELGA